MTRALPLLLLAAALAACPEPEPEPGLEAGYEVVAQLDGPASAVGQLGSGRLLAATASGLFRADSNGDTWTQATAAGLPEGRVVFVGGGDVDQDLVFVHGGGLHRTTDEGETFESVTTPPVLPLQGLLNPRADVFPMATATDSQGRLWLAGIGGLFVSSDGLEWANVPVAGSGSLNVLFTDVTIDGDDVWAVAQLADSMLPAAFEGLLSGTVFHSPDAGATWEDDSAGLDATAPMAVALDAEGDPCVATLDRGVWCKRSGAWTQLGGDFDAVDLFAGVGGLHAATASRGVWIRDEAAARWARFGDGPMRGITGSVAVAADGTVLTAVGRPVEESGGDAGGTVSVALSFHANYYHSYRGDSNSDDGYGLDIDVIRTILGWLETHPVRADWDIENYFTLDGWMAAESPDILAAIQSRVASGIDDVRVMSWNNGAVAAQTKAEFDESIGRALASYEAVFADVTRGVQPQENMFDPDHIAWYRALGIDWITLFYSANGFSSMRPEVDLDGADLYGPVTIVDPASGADMTWVPVYHHADVLDHGGLAAWVRQIRATVPGDSLLVIHFDADGESWENFGAELDRLQPLVDAGAARYTTIQDYLDTHEATTSIEVTGDLADGSGDGFQSWAEKDVNHEVWTRIAASRRYAAAAAALGGDDAEVGALLAGALESRLIALSTTHFGLAAPYLHNDRANAARSWSETTEGAALEALEAAVALDPPAGNEVLVVNVTDAEGPALFEVPVSVPADDWVGPEGLHLRRGATPIPMQAEVVVIGGDVVEAVLRGVVPTAAGQILELTWLYDLGTDPASAGLTTDDLPDDVPLGAPFTECGGERAVADPTPLETHVDAAGVVVSVVDVAPLPLCGAEGTVAVTRQRWAGLDGTVVVVNAAVPEVADPDAAESIALSPLSCDGLAESLSWDTWDGTHRTRPMRPGVDTWNASAARSWVRMACADGGGVDVAHRATDRSSMAFAPVRERDGVATLAPLGTLWGRGGYHDARRTGGSGLGDVATWLVGSQFRPAAPDWSGAQVSYRLLVGDGLEPGTMELFAHPPVVVTATSIR